MDSDDDHLRCTPTPELGGPPSTSPASGNTPERASRVSSWMATLETVLTYVTNATSLLDEIKMEKDDLTEEKTSGMIRVTEALHDAYLVAVSISSARWSTLSTVGVRVDSAVLPVVSIHETLVSNLRERASSYDQVVGNKVEEMFREYQTWEDDLVQPERTEAATRILVDCAMRHVYSLSRSLPVSPRGPGRTFMYPEMPLSSAQNRTILPSPSENLALSLAGRADYVHIHVGGWEYLPRARQAAITTNVKRLNINSKPFADDELRRVCFSLIETKRGLSGAPGLASSLPQAVVEALVLSLRWKSRVSIPPPIPFTLTNGTEWIFGILKKVDPVPEDPSLWQCWHTSAVSVAQTGLGQNSTPDEQNKTRGSLRIILEMLLQWTCADRDLILQQGNRA